jgi:hypothetical protein
VEGSRRFFKLVGHMLQPCERLICRTVPEVKNSNRAIATRHGIGDTDE